MTRVEIDVYHDDVMQEVAQTTAYAGAKAVGDEGSYERVSTVDGDVTQLERFWLEACSGATALLRPYIDSMGAVSGRSDYSAVLSMPTNWDVALLDVMTASLRSYFVEAITAKWFMFSNKGDVQAHSALADAALSDVRVKLCHRKKPSLRRHS